MSGGSNPSRPVFYVMEFVLGILVLFLIAYLFSATGHGGGSGYLALFLIFGFLPMEAKLFALSLNVLVSYLAFLNFRKAGLFDSSLAFPLLIGSLPAFCIFVKTVPSEDFYNQIVGLLLLFSALRLFDSHHKKKYKLKKNPKTWMLVLLGFCIGGLAGFIGIGGGIFLSPLLIFFGWADPKKTAAISSIFVLANSALGVPLVLQELEMTWWLIITALISQSVLFLVVGFGGWLGSLHGSKKFNKVMMNRALGAILLMASVWLFS